jgi:enamine deaminase RidA (YjgF/YER057c/UK114 family)
MADVVKITAFLTDMSDYGEFAKARTQACPAGVPASAACAAPARLKPGLLVEVDAVAIISGR